MGYKIKNELNEFGDYFDVNKKEAEAGELIEIGFPPGPQGNDVQIGVCWPNGTIKVYLPINDNKMCFRMPQHDVLLKLCIKK